MAPPRVWADAACLDGTLDGETWHHLHAVLRVKVGDEVIVNCGDGWEYRLAIRGADRRRGQVTVLDRHPLQSESAVPVRLGVGLLKGDQMDLVVQVAVELGVSALCALVTERSLGGARIERWQKIARQATAQCRRGTCMAIEPVEAWSRFIARPADGTRVVFWEQAAPSPARPAWADASAITVAIGPEGGLSAAEVEQARTLGWMVCSLGPRILRAQTAAMVAPAIVLAELNGSPPPGAAPA